MQTTSHPHLKPTVVTESGGEMIRAFGDELLMKVGPGQTGGSLTLFLGTTQPGGGPPPHWHENEHELFMVQEGRMRYLIADEWRELGPGGVVFAPRQAVHTFHNASSEPARHWIALTPSGFETFFARCAAEFAKPGGPEMERIVAISAEHGIYYVSPSPAGEGQYGG